MPREKFDIIDNILDKFSDLEQQNSRWQKASPIQTQVEGRTNNRPGFRITEDSVSGGKSPLSCLRHFFI